jgi:hypothetical protein
MLPMHRVPILLALSGFVAIGGAASAAVTPNGPSPSHTDSAVINLSGDEYADANNNLLNSPRGMSCSAPAHAPAPVGCWTWSATHLGHGTYTLSQPRFRGAHLVWTITFTDTRGDSLTGELVEGFIPDPSPSDAITHANRYPATYTFSGGTGAWAGVVGRLNATTTTTTAAVDPATGTAHTRFASKAVGTLTIPTNH